MSVQPLSAKELGLDVRHSPLFFRQMQRALSKDDYFEVIRLSLDLARCRGYLLWSDQKKVQDMIYQFEIEREVKN